MRARYRSGLARARVSSVVSSLIVVRVLIYSVYVVTLRIYSVYVVVIHIYSVYVVVFTACALF